MANGYKDFFPQTGYTINCTLEVAGEITFLHFTASGQGPTGTTVVGSLIDNTGTVVPGSPTTRTCISGVWTLPFRFPRPAALGGKFVFRLTNNNTPSLQLLPDATNLTLIAGAFGGGTVITYPSDSQNVVGPSFSSFGSTDSQNSVVGWVTDDDGNMTYGQTTVGGPNWTVTFSGLDPGEYDLVVTAEPSSSDVNIYVVNNVNSM